ncbi:MAG: hypothetical protein WC788_05325 [Candidatus Paceibacterota bacterium]
MEKINLGLENKALYEGCQIIEVGGRLTLTTPVAQATNIVGRNVAKIVATIEDKREVTLTGAMAVWSYLIVFHQIVHKVDKVYYDDGRTGPVLIAQH